MHKEDIANLRKHACHKKKIINKKINELPRILCILKKLSGQCIYLHHAVENTANQSKGTQ